MLHSCDLDQTHRREPSVALALGRTLTVKLHQNEATKTNKQKSKSEERRLGTSGSSNFGWSDL